MFLRINKRTYPAIQAMIDGSAAKHIPLIAPDAMASFREKKLMGEPKVRAVARKSISYREEYLKDVFIISSSFEDAAYKARAPLHSIYTGQPSFGISATYIVDKSISFLYMRSKNGVTQEVGLCVYSKSGEAIMYYFLGSDNDNEPILWVSNALQEKAAEFGGENEFVLYMISRLVLIELFRRNAEVETVFAAPHKKTEKQGVSVLNETDLSVKYLDCKWFKNIVRSEGFSVRGHFRLQPKKVNGEWTKELIWINDFEKHGYTSKARILNQED